MAQEIASLFAKISADVSDFQRGMSKMKDDMTAQERGIQGLQSAIGTGLKAAAVVTTAAIAGLAAGITSSVAAASAMEQGIADIGAMMSLTTEETAQLQDHIMALGLSPKLKVSATEAAGAVMALGTAGLSMTEIMGGASEATVLLANATGLKGKEGFASAASIATDVMAQFNIKAEDLDKAVSAIAGTTVASKFTIDDYRLAIAQAGGVAGSVGVEFDDFNAVIAATSPSFASGSDAGTSFKTFLQRLVPQTDKAKTALIQLGLSTGEDVVTAFFDAQGAMRPMEEISENLQNAFSGLSEAQKIEAASTIFGTDAMRTALALAEGGSEIITEMKKAIGNVDAEELAKKRMDTLAGSWEIFQGVVETLQLGLGQKFIPVVRSVVDWLTGLAQKYGPMVIDMFGTFANRIADFIPLLGVQNALYEDGAGLLMELTKVFGVSEEAAQAFWSQVWNVKQVISEFIQAVTDTFKPITDLIAQHVSWTDVIIGTAAALTVMLWPAIMTAIGALASFVVSVAAVAAPILAAIAVVAALRAAWVADFGGIQGKTASVMAFVSDTFAATSTYLKTTFGGLATAIQQFGSASLQEIYAWATGNATTFESTQKIWEAARVSFTTAFTDMSRKITEWGATAWAEFKERFPGAAQALQDAFASISTKFGELWAVVKPLVMTLITTIQDMAAKWNSSTVDMGSALGVAKTVIDTIWKVMITLTSTAIGVMIDTLKLVTQLLTGNWAGAWNTAKGMVSDVLQALKTVVSTTFQAILQIFGVNIEDITRWRDRFVDLLAQVRDNAVGRMTELKDRVIGTVREFVDSTRNTIESWRAAIVQKYQDIVSSVRDKMDMVKSAIVEPIKSATGSTLDTISGWRDNLAELVGRLRENILAHMAGIKANVIEPVKGFITDSSERIATWVTWVVDHWQEIKDAAKEKWIAIKMAIIEPVTAFVSATIGKINEWKEWIVEKFRGIWEGVQNAFRKAGEWAAWGRDIIQGLWDGISEKWQRFVNWFTGTWDGLVHRFQEFFGIRSPSTLFAGFGRDMMAGLQGGVSDGTSGVTAAFNGLSSSISTAMSNVASVVSTQMNSTIQSVVEGVRYGAGLVNMATADVLHQSMLAEQQARAKWEALKREMATPLPPPPTYAPPPQENMPIVSPPTTWLPPVIVPPGQGGVPLPPTVPFNEKFLMGALQALFPSEDISDEFGDVKEFSRSLSMALDNAILSGNLAESQLSQQEQFARQVGGTPQDYAIEKILDSIQLLIQTIITRGLGSSLSFDISQSPTTDYADNRQELGALVAYLNALYAT